MPSISGQSILVLGGSSGIGAAVAKLALEQGVHVFIASSNSTKVAKAVEALQNAAPNAKVGGFTINLDTPRIEEDLVKLLTEILPMAPSSTTLCTQPTPSISSRSTKLRPIT